MIHFARCSPLLVILALGVPSPDPACAAEIYTVSGVLQVRGFGKLYVFQHDSESFRVEGAGLQTLVLDTPGSELVEVPFSFRSVGPGTYAIRCFQDRNGNGRLDKGLFGPSEPWGITGEKHRRPPRFEEVQFTVAEDVTTLVIPVE